MDLSARASSSSWDASWAQFVLSTVPASHVQAARHGLPWIHVDGNLFTSGNETHLCTRAHCRSWVTRPSDGLRICAISGMVVDGKGWESRPAPPRLLKRNSSDALRQYGDIGKENKRRREQQLAGDGMEEEVPVCITRGATKVDLPPSFQAEVARPNAYDRNGDAKFLRSGTSECGMDTELPPTQVGLRSTYIRGAGHHTMEVFSSPCAMMM